MAHPLQRYDRYVQRHFDKLLTHGLDRYGLRFTAMWMASLDTRTGKYPQDDTRPAHIGKRVYRYIDAPRGCSLYWDQPSLVAAHALSRQTGQTAYADAADAYVRDYLACGLADNGVLLWGNHYYYDAFEDCVVKFPGSLPPAACDMATETGDYHEIRPIPPAWGTLWQVDAQATQRAIRSAAAGHLVDPDTGLFNRHADNRRGCAFLEHGGTMIEALAWLYARTGDADLLQPARAMADYSFAHRDPSTGLLENNPTETRWDKYICTTEVGLWAGCLLRTAAMTCDPTWIEPADAAMRAWLKYGYDEKTQRYFGRLRVADGQPVFDPPATLYEPGDYADLWRPQFPAHDYPMAMAEACLMLYQVTGHPVYEQACHRWRRMIQQSLPARGGQGGYAEHYGRCIHFLLGGEAVFGRSSWRQLAEQVANEAVTVLFAHDMFRTHPGEDRYDAVDGAGFLALGLLWLATGQSADMMGLGW